MGDEALGDEWQARRGKQCRCSDDAHIVRPFVLSFLRGSDEVDDDHGGT